MQEQAPKVSVLTPLYRTEETHLCAAIESVLAQSMADFELILLDDDPANSRKAIVARYNDPRIRYFANERNLGITPSRNKLIDLARGEYLAVFDHDDVCRADRLAKQVAYLDAHPACGVVSSWTQPLPKGDLNRYAEDDHAIRVSMMNGCTLWHPAAMIRRRLLAKTGIRYEEEFSPVEDYMLWLKLLPHTRFHNIPEPLLGYRWHATNTSVVKREQLEAQVAHCRAWAKVNLPELWAEYELRRTHVARYKLFGLPFLKVTQQGRWTHYRLFNTLPVLSRYAKDS